MQTNSNTNRRPAFTKFPLGQTYITPGAEEALLIAGQTGIEFLRRHMTLEPGELSDEDVTENELSLREGFRLLSAYRTAKGQKLYVTWNKGSDRFVLGFRLSIYLSSSRGCGNCGKLDVLCRVFQALWERWKNAVCFSTVSIARQFPQPVVYSQVAHALPTLF
jgi:hypothetical protein